MYFISNVPDIQLKMEFREGFGRTYLEIYQFENVRTDELTSWIIDGDTTGNVYQFSESPELVKNDLNFYPNPATTEIHLPENLQRISFINISGQEVLSSENPNQTIFIGDLPKGIYLVQAIDANGNLSTTKLIIE
ncbi:MAG: T9SS type A sorting domain-containing protein [Crocinitomicaceae bacterium]|nr:T9SS type A sorting domain-containing protein [Crocinitomicaceae bacterium]